MSSATLDIRWSEEGRDEISPASLSGDYLSSRIGVRLHEQHCPSCNSIVYTRRHSRCGVCEQVLPAGFLFSGAEAERVDQLLRTERRRHRAWLNRSNV